MTSLRRLAAILASLVALLSVAVVVPGAGADTVESKQAEAERIAAEIDQLDIQASQLDEQHHQALLQLEATQAEILDAQDRVDELQAETDEQQSRLESYAVQAYIGGDNAPSMDTFLESSEPNEFPTKVAYLSVATGDQQDLLDSLNGAQASLDAELTRLHDAEAEAQRLEQEAAASLDAAQQAVADREAIYARVQGELADLVAQEQARRAEEERRRAEEAARQAAEDARAAAPPAAPTQDEVEETNAEPPAAPPTTTPPPEADQPTPPPTGGGGGATPGADIAVSTAYSLLGTPYVWGGSSPSSGFDCSGFTAYVWGQAGRSLPHSAAAQSTMVRRLPLSELLPGDLVFYGYGYVHHVALYVGGGTIVHAPRRGDVVRVDSIYYWDDLHWAGRLP